MTRLRSPLLVLSPAGLQLQIWSARGRRPPGRLCQIPIWAQISPRNIEGSSPIQQPRRTPAASKQHGRPAHQGLDAAPCQRCVQTISQESLPIEFLVPREDEMGWNFTAKSGQSFSILKCTGAAFLQMSMARNLRRFLSCFILFHFRCQ